MDVRWAREQLGIAGDEPLSDEQLRRAYLRRVRVHSPERDPDGFKRVREAYDFLLGNGRLQALLARVQATASADSEVAVSAVPEPTPVEDEAHVAATAALAAPSPQATRVAELWEELESLDHRREPERAFAVLNELLEASARGGAPIPAPDVCLEVVLELLARGRREDAEHLLVCIEERLAAEGRPGQIPPYVAGQLALVNELLALAPFTTNRLLTALARAMLQGDMSSIAADMKAELKGTDGNWPHIFEREAPSLFAAARRYLPRQRRLNLRGSWRGWAPYLMLFMLLSAARICNTRQTSRDETTMKQVRNIEASMTRALADGTCAPVGQLWADYLRHLRELPSRKLKSTSFIRLQRQASARCAEHRTRLSELP